MLGYLFTKVTTASDKKMIFHTQCGKILAIPIGTGKEEPTLVGAPFILLLSGIHSMFSVR